VETGAIVGVTVHGADKGDTMTIADTVTTAAEQLEAVATVTKGETSVIEEVVADKGYHSNETLLDPSEDHGFFLLEAPSTRRQRRGSQLSLTN
jgi:transposase